MSTKDTHSFDFKGLEQSKDSNKVTQLKSFVTQSKYIDVSEQKTVCKSFGLPYLKFVFQEEYRNRFFDCLKDNTTTVATVSLLTNIPHEHLYEFMAYYENKGLLRVITYGKCPTTGSMNVKFVSTNNSLIDSIVCFPKSKQEKIF